MIFVEHTELIERCGLCNAYEETYYVFPRNILYIEYILPSSNKSNLIGWSYPEPIFLACKRQLTATSVEQTFTSPGYPDTYDTFEKCDWLITSTKGTVELRFLDFAMESCKYATVEIYIDGTLHSQWCDDSLPPSQVFRGEREIRVQFKTGNYNSDGKRGFRAVYQRGEFISYYLSFVIRHKPLFSLPVRYAYWMLQKTTFYDRMHWTL